ncbi:hypothetical protein XELAEV_18021953mg [Xenopus laevis]|uniref:Uncharacterized protein n=1 Tax=Xenopus laevis TaxID=8355 RepID=A0A974D1F9_XENLA|nr:hypothetical protein XELAEV_18021953mg [Xenopus laevis]
MDLSLSPRKRLPTFSVSVISLKKKEANILILLACNVFLSWRLQKHFNIKVKLILVWLRRFAAHFSHFDRNYRE